MDVLSWQDIVYPVLVFLSLMMAFALVATYWLMNRRKSIFWLSMFFFSFGVSMSILTLVTGNNPLIDINQFRPLILYSRIATAVILAVCLYYQVMRLIHRG